MSTARAQGGPSAVRTDPRLHYAAGTVLVLVILVGCGWAVTTTHAKYVVALAAALALATLALHQRGAYIAVLLLAVMNGVPFLDTSASVAHHISAQDLACLILISSAAAWTISAGSRAQPTRIARLTSTCGLALLLWCAFTVARASVTGDAPVLGGMRMGRDFLYFAGLLVFLPRVRLDDRQIRTLMSILVVGVCLFSLGQIVTVLGVANPSFLVHAAATGQTLGLTRVFAPMNDLLFAGAAVGIAVIALARRRETQLIAVPVTLLLATSLAVQLTRARWIALILSVVVVSVWLTLQAERSVAARLRQRMGVLVAGLAAAVVSIMVLAPSVISAGPLVQRFVSIATDVGSSNATTSTIAVRQQIANAMVTILGGNWPLGVGLIPPSVHYYTNLPGGSLRDPDVGVLNAIMTIGVIGAVLIYLPLVVVLVHCMRRVRSRTGMPQPWLTYGGQVFIVAAIASSVTLITLFSVAGLMLTAVFLAVLCQANVSGGDPSGGDPSVARPQLLPP